MMLGADILGRLCDVHCHPIDDSDFESVKRTTQTLSIGSLCCMSSSPGSLDLTAQLASCAPDKVIPAYGIHPWFCHALSAQAGGCPTKEQHYISLLHGEDLTQLHPDISPELLDQLPLPIPLSRHVADLRQRLQSNPRAMVGEIGLDRSFRIPQLHLPTHERKLTSVRTPIEHQRTIFDAQLDLAIEMQRNASVHAVHAQAEIEVALNRAAKKWGQRMAGPPKLTRRQLNNVQDAQRSGEEIQSSFERGIHIDLHSPLISVETMLSLNKTYPNTLYFSFSTTICARSPRLDDLLATCPNDRLLIESDFNSPNGMEEAICSIFQRVCSAKQWSTEQTCQQLETNWKQFAWL